MTGKELLPIGSVVQLENSTALVMVAGYLPVSPSRPGYVWDYSGFRFPIGFTDDNAVFCFNHSQIEIVYARGYQDIEEESFMNKLQKLGEQAANLAGAGGTAPSAAGTEAPKDGENGKKED